MKDFFKAFLSFGAATSIEKIVGFALLPYYTQYFSTEEYGIIDLLQVAVSTLAIFAVLQLETSLQRYYYDYEGKERGTLIFTLLSIVLAGSLLVTSLVVIFSNGISQLLFRDQSYSPLIQIAALQIPLSNLTMLCLVLLRYEKRNLHFLLSIIVKVVCSLLLIYLYLAILDLGVIGSLYAQLISSLFSLVFMMILIRRYLVFDFSIVFLKKSLNYSLPQFPARVGSVLLSYSNRFFMAGILTVSAIGIFSLSLKLASIVQLVYTAFVMAWAPFMFEKRNSNNHKIVFANVLTLAASVVFGLVSIIPLIAGDILKYVISAEFADASKYVGGLCLSFSLLIFKEIVDIGPKYMEKTKYLSFTFFVSFLVNVLSLALFIPVLGISGVVCSLILTNTILLAVSWIISNRLYPISFEYRKFIILAIPSYMISVSTLYIEFEFWIRIAVAVFSIMMYGIFSFYSLKAFRNSLAIDHK